MEALTQENQRLYAELLDAQEKLSSGLAQSRGPDTDGEDAGGGEGGDFFTRVFCVGLLYRHIQFLNMLHNV